MGRAPWGSNGENGGFGAADGPFGAVVAEPAEDWLCAASSALMVAGDICEPPPGHGGGVELPVAGPFQGKSKGFVAPCPKPVDCGDGGFRHRSHPRPTPAGDPPP